ncbi:putative nitrate assimilation regulatory protein nira [Diplodia seriata]|uniref:Putative nitrate assimilation regulatory protein nira n=1 Tax=Diplodia seriata TaxID=420778 RepID=A0A0G2GTW0_9PEZI|nr:putative nitrate assimilation regulatory protein nira [Diplodia seriata]
MGRLRCLSKTQDKVCKAGGKDCVYDTEQGETRTAALKNMNTALERNLSSAMHALRMLQTWPEDEAEHLFQRLRFAADLPAFLSTLQTPLPAEPPPHCRSQWVDIPDVLRYIRDNLDDIKHAFSIYIERTTMLFHVYTEDDVSRILALVDEPSVLDIPGPVLCEVCSIVAIASHFDRQRVPPDKSDLMYSVAKHFLDDLVLQNPLRAIKQRPRTVDQHSWLDAKKVWRSLVLCKGWLQATLGYLPSKPTTFVPDLCLIGTADVQDAAEFFRTEFTKISILKAKILNTAATPDLSQRTIDDIRHDLQRWYDSLPPQWGLARNLQTDTDHSPTRITTSYLHLLHLGAIMLLHRRIVSNHRRLMRTQADPGRDALEAIQGAAEAVHDGVTAARLSARLLALIMAEGGITRHCWICIFQSYMSCCTLLYTSLHKRLMLRRRRSPPRKEEEEEEEEANGGSGDEDDAVLAGRALAILSHCAKLDPGALALERTLLPYSAMLLGKADGDGIQHPFTPLPLPS